MDFTVTDLLLYDCLEHEITLSCSQISTPVYQSQNLERASKSLSVDDQWVKYIEHSRLKLNVSLLKLVPLVF